MIRPHQLNRTARYGLALVLGLLLVGTAAPLLAPFDPAEQLDPAVGRSRPPLTRLWVVYPAVSGARVRLADRVERTAESLTLGDRGSTDQLALSAVDRVVPRWHLLGTDRLGRDILSRVVLGARTSLAVGCLSAILALSLGLLVGSAAALGNATIDAVLMRTVDGLMAFPPLLLVLALALLFEPSTAALVAVIGGTSWMGLSRLIRAELRRVKTQDFILAGRSSGVSELRILFHHLLPNASAPILVATSLLVGDAILVESALSFLGLGVAADLPSWGRMIADGRSDLVSFWWISTFPGLAIVVTVLAFHLLSDGLRDALDPVSQAGVGRASRGRPTGERGAAA